MISRLLTGMLAGLAMTGLATVAQADSDLENALKAGAKRLTADEIAERLTGKTVTFAPAKSTARILVYYGTGNQTAVRKIGTSGVTAGFHAVTDRNQMCLGLEGKDLPRLRCWDVLLIDGVITKFKADGSLYGRIMEIADGNTT